MSWEMGISVITGLRIIPESRLYQVRDEHVDLVLSSREETVRCCIVSKYDMGSAECLHLPTLSTKIRDAVLERTNGEMDVRTITFTGNFHFPKVTLKRFTNEFDVWALGDCVKWQ